MPKLLALLLILAAVALPAPILVDSWSGRAELDAQAARAAAIDAELEAAREQILARLEARRDAAVRELDARVLASLHGAPIAVVETACLLDVGASDWPGRHGPGLRPSVVVLRAKTYIRDHELTCADSAVIADPWPPFEMRHALALETIALVGRLHAALDRLVGGGPR